MKRFSAFFCCLSVAIALSFDLNAQQVFKTTKSSVIGYLEYLPEDYHRNAADYPVVIFLHGRGEKGPNSTSPEVLERGAKELTKLGPPHFVKKGTRFPFILISPQLKSRYSDWPLWYVLEVLEHVKSTLRVDAKRIYLTGLSLGGGGVWTTAEKHPEIFAAIAPVCGSRNSRSEARRIADNNLPVWAFHGDKDNIIPLSTTLKMIESINAYQPNPRARITIYKGVKHNSWDYAYKPDNSMHKPNIYEWMLSHSRNDGSQEQQDRDQEVNKLPVVNAGNDQTITSDRSRFELTATASDPDGKIVRYDWKKVSGGDVRMEHASTPRLVLSGLRAGTYEFRLTVVDDKGAASADNVRVHVKQKAGGTLVANGGPDRVLKLPVTHYTLAGGATSPDGVITSYEWNLVDGPPLDLADMKTRVMKISNVRTPGRRTFTLTVTDSKGRKALDHVRIYFEDQSTSGKMFDEAVVIDGAEGAFEQADANMSDPDKWNNELVSIYNERGEVIFTGKWNSGTFKEVFQQKGLYLYRLHSSSQRLASGKIFID